MSITDFSLSVLASVVASVLLSVLIYLVIERRRKPNLVTSIGSSHNLENDPAGRPPAKWLYVSVQNKSIPAWLSPEPAMMCEAWLTFYHINRSPDYRRVYDREMLGRWTDSPQPDIRAVNTSNGMVLIPYNMPSLIDIPPHGERSLGFVMKLKGEDECYGFNNDSYVIPDWKNPNWKLEKGAYFVKVRIRTGGRDFVGAFRIVNDVSFNDFRLENVPSKLVHELK